MAEGPTRIRRGSANKVELIFTVPRGPKRHPDATPAGRSDCPRRTAGPGGGFYESYDGRRNDAERPVRRLGPSARGAQCLP